MNLSPHRAPRKELLDKGELVVILSQRAVLSRLAGVLLILLILVIKSKLLPSIMSDILIIRETNNLFINKMASLAIWIKKWASNTQTGSTLDK